MDNEEISWQRKLRQDVRSFIDEHSDIKFIDIEYTGKVTERFVVEKRSVEGTAALTRSINTDESRMVSFEIACDIGENHMSYSRSSQPIALNIVTNAGAKSILDFLYASIQTRAKIEERKGF